MNLPEESCQQRLRQLAGAAGNVISRLIRKNYRLFLRYYPTTFELVNALILSNLFRFIQADLRKIR